MGSLFLIAGPWVVHLPSFQISPKFSGACMILMQHKCPWMTYNVLGGQIEESPLNNSNNNNNEVCVL